MVAVAIDAFCHRRVAESCHLPVVGLPVRGQFSCVAVAAFIYEPEHPSERGHIGHAMFLMAVIANGRLQISHVKEGLGVDALFVGLVFRQVAPGTKARDVFSV